MTFFIQFLGWLTVDETSRYGDPTGIILNAMIDRLTRAQVKYCCAVIKGE